MFDTEITDTTWVYEFLKFTHLKLNFYFLLPTVDQPWVVTAWNES